MFFYRWREIPEPVGTYYTDEEIEKVRIYRETPELAAEYADKDDNGSDLCVVTDGCGKPVCDERLARYFIKELFNLSIWEDK